MQCQPTTTLQQQQNNGDISTNGNMRHASVKEIANTLSEFDYKWDDKFLLLAIYTRLKGVARMWLDASSTLNTT